MSRAHRAALDHVLALVADSPLGGTLVLRGSMAMPAWVEQAREPADLDWVVRPPDGVPLSRCSPYPYLNSLDHARTWPEATQGAVRQELWEFEDVDTNGIRVRLPPEGTRWVRAVDMDEPGRPHEDVLDLIREHPQSPGGPLLDPDEATETAGWAYDYRGDFYDADLGEAAVGARLLLPWRHGDESGLVQLDFAYGERMPDVPVLTAIPRGDGGPPTATWTASATLSLAWKLQWLHADQSTRSAAGKDLYDAVLLAERDGMRLAPRLRAHLMRRVCDADALRPDRVRSWHVDWPRHLPGSADAWMTRLAAALPRVLDPAA